MRRSNNILIKDLKPGTLVLFTANLHETWGDIKWLTIGKIVKVVFVSNGFVTFTAPFIDHNCAHRISVQFNVIKNKIVIKNK
jgi:hypothetical protein